MDAGDAEDQRAGPIGSCVLKAQAAVDQHDTAGIGWRSFEGTDRNPLFGDILPPLPRYAAQEARDVGSDGIA
ncbi:hypothetical protein A3736_02445 [Erythrobacter sp. HI0063]|nr:hypothetical protein A3736_02445 [Erythrobacter sp. HI0063]